MTFASLAAAWEFTRVAGPTTRGLAQPSAPHWVSMGRACFGGPVTVGDASLGAN